MSTKRSVEETGTSDWKKSKTNDYTEVNRYLGWTVPSNNYQLPTIDIENITPEQFYNTYVQNRRPIVIQGIPPDLSKLKSWDNCHLNKKAGDQTVSVERRSDTSDGYGKGNEIRMKFSQFISLVQNEDNLHYLTTQDVPSDDNGRPDILPDFMKALSDDFPIQPKLTGNLIPQNINLWMGNSTNFAGASSGLHHDYHDNLYVVLKGRKRFRLFSPMDTQYLYTRGELLQVHPNGRINYTGEETTAYGTDIGADAAAKAAMWQKRAEERLQEAERGVEEGKDGAIEELAEAEEALELAMDALIDAQQDNDDDTGIDDDNKNCEIFDGHQKRLVDKTVKNPNNFSKIPVEMLEDTSKARQEYPNLQRATMAYCNIKSGDMLYLPASWFHEVWFMTLLFNFISSSNYDLY